MNINWSQGTSEPQASRTGSIRVTVAGDWGAIWDYAERLVDDSEAVYGDLLPELRASDLRIVNLETPLTDRGEPIDKGGPNLRASPAAIAGLTTVPVHVACLANNHILDYGPAGLDQTLDLLQGAGIQHLGAGLSRAQALAPLTLDGGGVRIGLVDLCEGEDCTTATDGPGVFGWEIDEAASRAARLATEVDVVLIIAHCGREYAPLPPPYVVAAFHRICDAALDAAPCAVVAHHPHVPQGIELYRGCPIFYSTGNFCFAQPREGFYRKAGYLVHLDLDANGVQGFEIAPYQIGTEGLQRLQDPLRRWLLQRLRQVSQPLADPRQVRSAWEAFIDRVGEEGLMAWLPDPRQAPLSDKQWANLRNTFVTPAHRELWIDATTRILQGEMGTAPAWARALVDEWAALSVAEAHERALGTGAD
jgi:poly-gamma-glutamate synthesis protein (capsule biosynthesis protein)